MHRRPYFFEIFTIANLVILEIVLRRIGFSIFTLFSSTVAVLLPMLVIQTLTGIAVRVVLAKRHGDPAYLRTLRTPRFLTDVARIIVFSVLWGQIYGWLKVGVPALNHRLYDQFFWNLDRTLFFGFSPNIFFLDLFSNPLALRAVDWTYANVFIATVFIGGAVFISSPDARLRIGFVNSNATMWIVGAWLYVALPAFDPCYRFPEIWLPLAQYLPQTQYLQRLLMTNYQNFTHLQPGRPAQVSLLLGLSAFPSLHTAAAFLAFLWMRGVSRAVRLLFGVFTAIIFIGSVVTGWHYLADSLAGLLLAALSYTAFHVLPMRFRRTHAAAH